MIQFPEPRDVKLRNVQTRVEKRGEEDVPAMDLAISVTGGNQLLDMLNPDLRRHLFKPITEQPGELSLPVDDLPSVRFPLLTLPFKYNREWVGHTARIAYGATGKADMVLGAVKVSKVVIEQLIEGGSVEIRFNLSTTDVNEKVIGKLSLMQGHDITLTLTPAEVAEDKQKPIDPKNDPAWPFPNGQSVNDSTEQPAKTPEELFTDQAPPAQ
jgi:hypothetical protein